MHVMYQQGQRHRARRPHRQIAQQRATQATGWSSGTGLLLSSKAPSRATVPNSVTTTAFRIIDDPVPHRIALNLRSGVCHAARISGASPARLTAWTRALPE